MICMDLHSCLQLDFRVGLSIKSNNYFSSMMVRYPILCRDYSLH